jgi:methylenetetrahydrofolate dehydrogenase (NADP+)/methenyltetrahydrofolate cyclohydrolase
MGKIIDGKLIAEKIKERVRKDALEFFAKAGRKPGLAVVLVGDNAASHVYVRNKVAACAACEVESFEYRLSAETSMEELSALINRLNTDSNVDGVLVQLPLPKHLNEREVLALLDPRKDVDGFHAMNAGALFLGEDCLSACTPTGCIELIKSTGESLTGKHAVVIGRSNIVGKPAAMLLLGENCTVTICHSKTVNLTEVARSADILVAAIGREKFVTADMIKPGAIVIDVGINRSVDGKLYGDVDFEKAKDVAGYITPVPGGVGPMTIAMLLSNTLKAANAKR